MIYQPRNVQPSSVSVDGSIDNTFSMEIQTNSYVSAYQLLIVDFNNNEVYTGSKVTLSNYLYNGDILEIPVSASSVSLSNGTNYKWRVRLYQPNSDMLITYGLVQSTSTDTNIYLQPNINIKAGMTLTINSQSKTISSYDVDTGLAVVDSSFSTSPEVGAQYYIYSSFIETVPDYIVYARQTPSVSINNVPESLTLKYHTFQGVYTQSDNVPIVYHEFDLYMQNDDGSRTLIDTSGKVYSANLSYTYDAFRTGSNYLIQMTVGNDMGIISTTDLYSFNVTYDIVEYLQQPVATLYDKENAINIAWVTPTERDATLLDVNTQNVVGANYLYNIPYNTVNSLYTNGYRAIWQHEDGLCILPDDLNISLQFSPDSNFFYDINGVYHEEMNLVEGETDATGEEGNFNITINKNKLVFTQNPNISLEAPFYTGTTQVFVNSPSSIAKVNNDYVWLDTGTWDDNGFWTEGGTSMERICNHWWKVQITKTGIKIEEIFPTT